MQKGGKQVAPCDDATELPFSKSSLIENIEVFRLAGYSTWTGEAAGSNPAFYTNPWKHSCNKIVAAITVRWCNG